MAKHRGRILTPAPGAAALPRRRTRTPIRSLAAVLMAIGLGLLAGCAGDNAGEQPRAGVHGFYGAASGGWSR